MGIEGVGGHAHTHLLFAIQMYSAKYIFFLFSGAKILQMLLEGHLAATVEDLGNLYHYYDSYHHYHNLRLIKFDIHQSDATAARPHEGSFCTEFFTSSVKPWPGKTRLTSITSYLHQNQAPPPAFLPTRLMPCKT